MTKLLSIFIVFAMLFLGTAMATADMISSKLSGYDGPVNCINFVDEQTGFAGCNEGKIFKTTNAGNEWFAVTVVNDPTAIFRKIRFFDAVTGYAVTHNGQNKKTTDAGNTWFTIGPGGGDPRDLYIFSATTIITCGGNGKVWKTTNSGANWTNYTPNGSSSYTFQGMTFSPTGKGIISSVGVWVSTNQGMIWENTITTVGGLSIIFNGNTCYMVGGDGTGNCAVNRSLNEGVTWATQTFQPGLFVDVSFANVTTGYAVGVNSNNAFLYKTTDNGGTWFNVMNKPGRMNSCDATALHIFIGADSGNVIRDNVVIAITPISTEVPQSFALNQNYPNPFNPVTNIEFAVTKTTNAKLTVFDVQGRVVEILVNESLKAGTYKVDFNANKLSSGTYFYRLQADDFVQTKKMILVK